MADTNKKAIVKTGEVIKSAELAEYHNRYLELTREAAMSTAYEAHFEAALLAPTLRLMKLRDFEGTFDQILFHLENAHQRARDEEIRRGIRGSMQFMVDSHLNIVENWIIQVQSGFVSGLAFNTRDLADVAMRVLRSGGHELPFAAFQKVLGSYFIQLSRQKAAKKEIGRFYNQLVHIYAKVLNSSLYSADQHLLMNSFLRVRDDGVLKASLQENGLALTTDLLRRFGLPPDAFGHSLHLMLSNLEVARPPLTEHEIYNVLALANEYKLPNRFEIQRDVTYQLLQRRFLQSRLRSEADLLRLYRNWSGDARLDKECLRSSILAQHAAHFGPRPVPLWFILALTIAAALVVVFFNTSQIMTSSAQLDWLSSTAVRYAAVVRAVPLTCSLFLLFSVAVWVIMRPIEALRRFLFRRRQEQFERQIDSEENE